MNINSAPTVYLAGPINHRTYGQATDWRDYAREWLFQVGIIGISPMRCKEHLKDAGVLFGSYEDDPLTSEAGIVAHDVFDVRRCDLILANFLGAEVASCGTPFEFGAAHILGKPIVTVMEERNNPFDHPFIRRTSGFRLTDLDSGLQVCKAILLP